MGARSSAPQADSSAAPALIISAHVVQHLLACETAILTATNTSMQTAATKRIGLAHALVLRVRGDLSCTTAHGRCSLHAPGPSFCLDAVRWTAPSLRRQCQMCPPPSQGSTPQWPPKMTWGTACVPHQRHGR